MANDAPGPGDRAPEFTLPDADGRRVSLAEFRGQPVILYFYPKDDTPGCTTEACNFRDRSEELKKAGAVVLGVSPDSPERHRKFINKFSLDFPLLADQEHTVQNAYGVRKSKMLYGKTALGVERSTFLIGPDGVIRREWRKVKVDGHVDEVLEALRETTKTR